MTTGGQQSGFTILETLIGMAIFAIVSTALYSTYGNVLQIVQSSQYNSAALNLIEGQVEIARNMRYEDLGTVGGVPAGKIPQLQTFVLDNTSFQVHAYVRNIDDPFDGTLGGAPNDTAPADYKLVEFQVTCATCIRYSLITMGTYVAPKNLESSSKNGNLFVRVFDASGQPLSGATVHVTNSSVNPAIDLTDITNSSGMLQLVDTATSSAKYRIVVSKTGYTTDRTYAPGSPPNPLKPDATVASQQLTISSLSIDRVSTLSVRVRDQFCKAVPGMDFLLTGTKLIATSPDVPKYSSAQATDANGLFTQGALEWGNFTVKSTDTVFDIAGKNASLSFTINPNASQSMTWLVASRSQSAMLTSVTDANGVPLDDATVQITKAGFSASTTTGRSTFTVTNWAGGAYDSKSILMNTDGTPGTLTLTQVNGVYATSSEQWLISPTYDLGSTSTTFIDLNSSPASQPAQTAMRIQVAGNNDNATWNWLELSGSTIPASLNANRYFRYKVLMSTTDKTVTPSLTDATIGFKSGCLMPGQAYINGLSNGAYTLTVTKTGYQPYSTPITMSTTWQQTGVVLTP